MNKELIDKLYQQAREKCAKKNGGLIHFYGIRDELVELIVRECINKIETHQIPVGNSAAGEMACEWTYAALKEISGEIKEHFGVEE